jgi:Tfp pilus assembly protein PilN
MKAVNLLPTDLRTAGRAAAESGSTPEPAGGATGAFVVLGVLAACVVGVAGYVLTNNTIKDRKAELAALDVRAQTAQVKANNLKKFADFDQLTNQRVATVKQLAGERFDWERVLRDLSRAIPANVTLSSLTGDLGSASSAGSGAASASSIRGVIAAPAITLDGCTTTQTDVATLMARLRGVGGVTRVSLTKSDRPDAGTSSSAPSASTSGTAGSTGGGAYCGNHQPPNFEVILFFEHDAAVTAAASSGSSTGTTTTGPTATPTPTPTPTGQSSAAAQGGTK